MSRCSQPLLSDEARHERGIGLEHGRMRDKGYSTWIFIHSERAAISLSDS
jgi:hypothetical protein